MKKKLFAAMIFLLLIIVFSQKVYAGKQHKLFLL